MLVDPRLNPLSGSLIDPTTGSHPAVRFETHPAVRGELYNLDMRSYRDDVIENVVRRTTADFKSQDPRLLLEETLYNERLRLRRSRTSPILSPHVANRNKRDVRFIGRIQAGLKSTVSLDDYQHLLKDFGGHFAAEICGNFEPKMYDFAIKFVPWMFDWILNAASVKRFIPGVSSESLQSRLRVVGEVEHLQKLAQKGTILLVPTHLSNIDSILIGYVIHLMSLPPFAYGAGLNLFSNPVLSFAMSRLGAYTVDRQKSSPLYKATLKNYSTEILKRGIHSIFFPAGGRVRSGAIESHLKLGLLGTALQAQLERYQENSPNPNIYVVPMVMNYHFVFEAASLIEDYLEAAGKHRFAPHDGDAQIPIMSLARFFWKLFSKQSEVWVRVGRPLDVFGNFVDENGFSLGPNGTTIDPKKWLISGGELKAVKQRDREYTEILGEKISGRYRAENIVLSSHLVAFSLFQLLRKQYPQLDLFRFLRISRAQRIVPMDRFYAEAEKCHQMVLQAVDQGRLHLSGPLKCGDVKIWAEEGIRQLGLFHDVKVARVDDQTITTDDMNLLYYYRNRLTGYGFGKIDEGLQSKKFFGETDEKGFLV
ncbi:MAG: 1-acyl-sn-glycerol-3-phosphate acyltransferase [Bdellovibrionales bacterium]|nr:1-acyl-sn-glycerol-3-phosphate acyltransferase [Bdellovibrionales bacterium]